MARGGGTAGAVATAGTTTAYRYAVSRKKACRRTATAVGSAPRRQKAYATHPAASTSTGVRAVWAAATCTSPGLGIQSRTTGHANPRATVGTASTRTGADIAAGGS